MKIEEVAELGLLLSTLIVYVIFFVCSPNGSNLKDRARTGGTLGPVSGRTGI